MNKYNVNIWYLGKICNELRLRALCSLRPVLWTCAQVRQRSVGSADLQCRFGDCVEMCNYNNTTSALRLSTSPWQVTASGLSMSKLRTMAYHGYSGLRLLPAATHLWLKGVYSHTLDVAPS
eukprot:s188_g32.t1